MTKEELRLQEDRDRKANWKRWGPYLSERQWGTVREDYSPYGAPGIPFPTIRRAAAPTVGVRTVLPEFQTSTSSSASPWPYGTVAILSLKNASSASPAARAITARM